MSGSLGSIPSHNPKFEIFDTHTLVAKVNLPTSKSSKQPIPKSRSNHLFQSYQPVITLKPHYNNSTGMINSSDINLKLTRHSNSNLEEKRYVYSGAILVNQLTIINSNCFKVV